MSTPTPVEALRRHRDRRARGVPTVTAMAGPVGLCARAWRAWAGGRPCAVAAATDPADVLGGWVAAALGATDLASAAERWVAAVGGPAPDGLARLTAYDVDRLWRALCADPAAPASVAARLVFAARAAGAAVEPGALVRALLGPAGGPGRVVRGIADLLPEAGWPALLLTPPPGSLPAALRAAEVVAAEEPRVPVGVAVGRDEYEAFAARFAGTRAAALAREGFVEVRGVDGNELDARLRAAGVDPPPASAVARLAADGVADDVAAAFVDAARAVRSPSASDLESDFRSVHERFLFEQLESLPATAGLFRPNRELPFRHGPRAAEADLLAAGLKLAVEVDGGFYHLNPDQYRRDRRKDVLYQRHGYLVLRFLAEDVVSELPTILDAILEAVAARRGSAPPTGAT